MFYYIFHEHLSRNVNCSNGCRIVCYWTSCKIAKILLQVIGKIEDIVLFERSASMSHAFCPQAITPISPHLSWRTTHTTVAHCNTPFSTMILRCVITYFIQHIIQFTYTRNIILLSTYNYVQVYSSIFLMFTLYEGGYMLGFLGKVLYFFRPA